MFRSPGRYKANDNIARDMHGPKGLELRLYVPVGEYILADAETVQDQSLEQAAREQKNMKPEDAALLKDELFRNHGSFSDPFFADAGGKAFSNTEVGSWAPEGRGPWAISPSKCSSSMPLPCSDGPAIVRKLLAEATGGVAPESPASFSVAGSDSEVACTAVGDAPTGKRKRVDWVSLRTNLLSKCTKELETLKTACANGISNAATTAASASDEHDSEFKTVMAERVTLAKAWMGSLTQREDGAKATVEENQKELMDKIKGSSAAALDEDNLPNLYCHHALTEWVANVKTLTGEAGVKAASLQWSQRLAAATQLLESMARSRKDLMTAINTRERQEKKRKEKESAKEAKQLKEAEEASKKQKEEQMKLDARTAGNMQISAVGGQVSLWGVWEKSFGAIASLTDVNGIPHDVNWSKPWVAIGGPWTQELADNVVVQKSLSSFGRLYKTASNKNYVKTGFGSATLERTQGLDEVAAIFCKILPESNVLDLSGGPGWLGFPDALLKQLQLQCRVHLYGMNPNVQHFSSKFGAESVQSASLRIHMSGNLQVVMVPPQALDRVLDDVGSPNISSFREKLLSGLMSEELTADFLHTELPAGSILYTPAGWLSLTRVRGAKDTDSVYGFQKCFYHKSQSAITDLTVLLKAAKEYAGGCILRVVDSNLRAVVRVLNPLGAL